MKSQENTPKIKYEIRDGCLWDEGRMIAVFTEDATPEDERLIKLGSEAVPAVENFINNVNTGNYKPRAAVKTLEQILKKYS